MDMSREVMQAIDIAYNEMEDVNLLFSSKRLQAWKLKRRQLRKLRTKRQRIAMKQRRRFKKHNRHG